MPTTLEVTNHLEEFYRQYYFSRGGAGAVGTNTAKITAIYTIKQHLIELAKSYPLNVGLLGKIDAIATALLGDINSAEKTISGQDLEVAGMLIVTSLSDPSIGLHEIQATIDAFQAYSQQAAEEEQAHREYQAAIAAAEAEAAEQARIAAEAAEQARLAAEVARLETALSVIDRTAPEEETTEQKLAKALTDPETVDPITMQTFVEVKFGAHDPSDGPIIAIRQDELVTTNRYFVTQSREATSDPTAKIVKDGANNLFDRAQLIAWLQRSPEATHPMTREVIPVGEFDTKFPPVSADTVDLATLNSCLNIQRIAKLKTAGLVEKWHPEKATKVLALLHPAYLQAEVIPALNSMDTTILTARNIADLNEQVTSPGFNAVTVLTAFSTPAATSVATAETDPDSEDDLAAGSLRRPQRRRRNATAGAPSSTSAAKQLRAQGIMCTRPAQPTGRGASEGAPTIGTGSLQYNPQARHWY
ncbi:MAG: hypothetical protein P1U63_13330 [Coxiellaceae bacterium]|nr:hypothetical protein [Coxiellaceae bacterium]